MELNIVDVELLLLIAAIVAITTRRLKIPYTIGLVLAGIALAFFRQTSSLSLTKDLIYIFFLPPLIFEAALYIRWRELRRDLPVIITFATVGVILSASITAIGMHYLVNWNWQSAILLGVLIAATDPVSVIATFKEAGVRGRLRLLVESESLFNDSTAAVVFGIALAFSTGAQITAIGTLQSLILSIAGGILCGLLVAGGVLLLAGRTDDHLVEITLTTIAAYGSFLLAENFHLSGVLATLTAGLLTGNLGSLGSISEKGRESVESFWEYAAFIVNSIIFILIGIREARQPFLPWIIPICAAIVVVIVGRALTIYPLSSVFSHSSLRVETSHQHILFWGGLRGALALALALGLPQDLPQREGIIIVAFGVVIFSICIQGLTMTPLLRKLNLIPAPAMDDDSLKTH